MITSAIDFVNAFLLPINFACHLVIFLGGFYVAIHSRIIPVWTSTCLWYIGLSSLLICSTILLQWIFGTSFPLAYVQIGPFAETVFTIIMAITAFLLLAQTVGCDLKNKKLRNKSQKIEI